MLAVAALALAACGRNGPPLPPPGPVAAEPPPAVAAPSGGAAAVPGPPSAQETAQKNAQKNGFDIYGNPVAPTSQKKTFLLDPLLQ